MRVRVSGGTGVLACVGSSDTETQPIIVTRLSTTAYLERLYPGLARNFKSALALFTSKCGEK